MSPSWLWLETNSCFWNHQMRTRAFHFTFYAPTGPCLITVKWPLARYMVLHNITRESVLRDNSDLFSGATIKLSCTQCTQGIFNGIYWAQPCSLPSGAIPRPYCLLYTPSSNLTNRCPWNLLNFYTAKGINPLCGHPSSTTLSRNILSQNV